MGNGSKSYTVEQIIIKLREVELHCNQGQTIVDACRTATIAERTYYRWRKQYSGLNINDAKRLNLLEKENAWLKKLVADQAMCVAKQSGKEPCQLYTLVEHLCEALQKNEMFLVYQPQIDTLTNTHGHQSAVH